MLKPGRPLLSFQPLILAVFLAACQPFLMKAPTSAPGAIPILPPQPSLTASPTHKPASPEPPIPAAAIATSLITTSSPTSLPVSLSLDPAAWRTWPVLPIVPDYARQIYLSGQTLGNDPHAFSVFGDCNSLPETFLGIYETDPQAVSALPLDLQETVAWFSGSFNRQSPTLRGGTTVGALLWDQWHQNRFGCTQYETPLQCELRLHKPSFVIIHVGTHYDYNDRNEGYMRSVLDQLIAAGVVPILSSKADDREQDEHVNAQYAQLAVEYNLPLWNFWAAVEDLPERGLFSYPGDADQGGLYLTDEAVAIHRLTALQALDLVRRAVSGP